MKDTYHTRRELKINGVLQAELQEQITDKKSKLDNALIAYLNAHEKDPNLSTKCDARTMLGVLIDTHAPICCFC